MDDYPGNSQRVRDDPPPKNKPEAKKVERVTQGDVIQRKKPIGKRFKETFVGGDARSVWGFVLLDVLIPAAKDMVAEATTQGVERMVFGEARGPRGRSGYRGGSGGHTNYSGYYGRSSQQQQGNNWTRNQGPQREVSRRARTNHDFGEIVLQTRGEAEEVVDRLFDLVARYDFASVADLYDLTGISGNYTDDKWGWTNLQGARAVRTRGGYLLDLPQPQPLD